MHKNVGILTAMYVIIGISHTYATSPAACQQEHLKGLQGCHLYTNGNARYLECLEKVRHNHKSCLISPTL